MGEKYFELTNPQKSIWLTNQMYPNSSIENIGGYITIEEKVNFIALKKSINRFIEKNDSFRIKFKNTENGVRQYLTEFEPFNVEIIKVNSESNVKLLTENIVATPFELINSLLFHFKMFEFPDGHGGFIINAHHLISDAWTASLLISEVIDNYAYLIHASQTIEEQYPSYIDYIKTEEEYLQSDRFAKDENYWTSLYQTIPEVASIPSNNIDFSKSLSLAKRMPITIDKELINKINDFCYASKISIYNFFMAIFSIYISKTTNLNEFVIGTPILNRSTFKEKHTTGMFISTVPFKINIEEDYTFSYFIRKISQDTLSMLRHQKYPYSALLETLRKNNPSTPNLYDILISYQNARSNRQTSSIPYRINWIFSNCTSDGLDISLYDMNDTGNIEVIYDYAIAKYKSSDIEQIHGRILHLINQALENPNELLINLEIVTPKEKEEIINSINNSQVEYPSNITIVDLFSQQVLKTPNHTALIYQNQNISYKSLENMVNVVTEKLKSKSIYKQKIAVISNKTPELIASLLGIMKSGNCYVPIDPSYPKERINYILEDCNASYIIAQKQYSNLCAKKQAIYLEDIDFLHYYNEKTLATENDLAYLIYTSGTTGNPKGVKILHKNIVNTLLWRKNFYPFDESIITLQVPSYSFDSSVEDIYTSLISGSTLVLPPSNKLDINLVSEEIEKHNINHFLVVPSLYKVMLAEKSHWLEKFKFITIAGEGFGINIVKEHFEKLPNVRLINEYGPTENSVCSTVYEFTKNDDKVLIGKAISNCHCYVLDKNLHFLPEGVSGELYVSGKGVSQGYLNKPEITKTHFIQSPFSDEILYKTGDIVKINENKLLEFIGRNDGQVKLNGFRIELKEIDNILLKSTGIKDSITVLKEMENGRKILVAYLVVDKEFSQKQLETSLKQNLPYYMIPDIQIMEAFPLTPNGKIDKVALPIPEQYISFKQVKPETPLEKEILEVCQQVLKNEQLGTTDDLFKLGMADSLSILTISSQLFAKNIKIETQDFYQNTTVKELAKLVNNKNVVHKSNINIVNPKYKTVAKEFSRNQYGFKYSNVLLTGVTGFLGIHLLYYLMTNTSSNVYCLVRKKNNQNANKRLEDTIINYLGKDFLIHYINRINVLEGDLSEYNLGLDSDQYNQIQNKIDCIIHSAAITKHYGKESIFIRENITSTKNLITFSKENNILLNYISTTTVSGNQLSKSNLTAEFTENDFFIGQDYESNPYVKSKFEAENLIFEEQYVNLKANIFRLGNLMGRENDGMFQKNKFDNAFYLRLLTFATMGMLPESLTTQELEFTPIDNVAKAIIELISFENSVNKTFHLFNNTGILASEIMNTFADIDIPCKIVQDELFIEKLKEKPNLLKYLVSDMDITKAINYSSTITVKNDITEKVLKEANFKWANINSTYLLNFFKSTSFAEDVNTWRNNI